MKKLLFGATLLLISALCNAQTTITFGYDLSGNRISRTIVMNSPQDANAAAGEAETPPPFAEQLTPDLQVRIYPNPTKGLLQLELTGLAPEIAAAVTVFNQSGQQIIRTDAARSVSTIDLSAYPSGTYVLRLVIDGKATDYKIIKN